VEPVFVAKLEALPDAVAGLLRDGDVLVTMGAGHIGAMAQDLPARLGAKVRA
jgi:UDP-N-acetylmuramate--alanine ligase